MSNENKRQVHEAFQEFKAGRYTDALESLRQLPSDYYDVNRVVILIEIFRIRNRDEGIRAEIDRLRVFAKSPLEVAYIDGMMFFIDNQFERCVNRLKSILGRSANDPIVASRVAMSYAALKDYERFDAAYTYIVEHDQKRNDYVDFYKGLFLYERGFVDESVKYLDIDSRIPYIRNESLRYRIIIAVKKRKYLESFCYFLRALKSISRKDASKTQVQSEI